MNEARAKRLAGEPVDLAPVQRLMHEEEMAMLAQRMRRDGHSPEKILEALWEKNSTYPAPLDEEEIDALIDRWVGDYMRGFTPRLLHVPMPGFMGRQYPPPSFVVENLIPRNEVTLAGGHGGSGKSILFLALAAHVASGRPWGSFEVQRSRVVFVSLEDHSDHVMHRLQKVVRTYQLSADEVEENLRVIDGTHDPELMIDCVEYGAHRLIPTQTLREVEESAKGAGLIIIDNASDAFGGNENARREVRAFIRELARIGRDNNAAVVLLAHIDKSAARGSGNGNSYSGSTAWHNSTRSRLALLEIEGQLQLHHEKHNRSRKSEPIHLLWTDDGVLIPATAHSAADIRAQQAKEDSGAVLDVMRIAQSRGIRVPTGTSGPATSWHSVEHMPEMRSFSGKNGKRRFHSALLALFEEGCLVRTPYRTEQRKLREFWGLTLKGQSV